MKLIGKLICWARGHKRGKRFEQATGADGTHNCFRCPRCEATWTRKARGVVE